MLTRHLIGVRPESGLWETSKSEGKRGWKVLVKIKQREQSPSRKGAALNEASLGWNVVRPEEAGEGHETPGECVLSRRHR